MAKALDWPWSTLGLDRAVDLREVKRAYAHTLKAIDRDDTDAFQTLRRAFETAKNIATTDSTTHKPSLETLAQSISPSVYILPTDDGDDDTSSVDEDQFFDDLEAVYKGGVWRILALEKVLARDIALGAEVRAQAEHMVFYRLSQALQNEEPPISPRVSRVLVANFAWSSDGVQFQRRFGNRTGYQESV